MNSNNPFSTQYPNSKLNWREDALCSQTDPNLFFPSKGEGGSEAKNLCLNFCPVREQCLKYAIASNERHGIWGGYTTKERDLIVKAQTEGTTPLHTKQQLREIRNERIRELYNKGVPVRVIAEQFGLNQATVRRQISPKQSTALPHSADPTQISAIRTRIA